MDRHKKFKQAVVDMLSYMDSTSIEQRHKLYCATDIVFYDADDGIDTNVLPDIANEVLDILHDKIGNDIVNTVHAAIIVNDLVLSKLLCTLYTLIPDDRLKEDGINSLKDFITHVIALIEQPSHKIHIVGINNEDSPMYA